MKKLILLFSLLSVLAFTQTQPFTSGTTKIDPAQISGPISLGTSGVSVIEENIIVGPIAAGLNMTLPATSCSYLQVYLNGVIQTSGQNVDYTVSGGVVIFNNNTVKPTNTVKLVCFR